MSRWANSTGVNSQLYGYRSQHKTSTATHLHAVADVRRVGRAGHRPGGLVHHDRGVEDAVLPGQGNAEVTAGGTAAVDVGWSELAVPRRSLVGGTNSTGVSAQLYWYRSQHMSSSSTRRTWLVAGTRMGVGPQAAEAPTQD